ncbi:hypothetical protein PLICRDRAFT_53446 [Plicaturopsis crispa FD-325 SS-3]|nr:hypothetical protein PLICRDRAFT_53446 [Plicaturopsis crispa FD-325 SS-3]
MAATDKPNVLIFGGLNTSSRTLAALLVPVEGESLVKHLRIVDKFSIAPPTTYLGAEFPKVVAKPNVEYKQANLTVPAPVASAFDPPEGEGPYDYVFDLTGEVRHDRPEQVQVNHTFNVARLIGLEAAKRKVKAYVRLQQPWYETSEKGSHNEKEDVKPLGTIGLWWHETLRMLAAIPDLNLVILRIGFVYGPYTEFGVLASVITVASVYGFLKQPMKSLWAPGKSPMYSVHAADVAGGLWACAEWIKSVGRKEADAIAGEEIIAHHQKSKVKDVEGLVPHSQKVIAPLFNLTDDSDSTMAKTGSVVTSLFGTTFEFMGFASDVLAKFKMDDVVEEINEAHVGAWTQMITTSDPPIPNTPLSAYMDTYTLSKHMVALSNTKIKEVIGYKLKYPELSHDALKEMVDKWKAEGSWPNLDG